MNGRDVARLQPMRIPTMTVPLEQTNAHAIRQIDQGVAPIRGHGRGAVRLRKVVAEVAQRRFGIRQRHVAAFASPIAINKERRKHADENVEADGDEQLRHGVSVTRAARVGKIPAL